jgi:hypothetical protein
VIFEIGGDFWWWNLVKCTLFGALDAIIPSCNCLIFMKTDKAPFSSKQ